MMDHQQSTANQKFNIKINKNELTVEDCMEDEQRNSYSFDTIMLLQQILQQNESETMVKRNNGYQMMKQHEVYIKSPRLLHRSLNYRTPRMLRNANELYKFKLKEPQRITMSKSLDVTAEAENHFHNNSLLKAKRLQLGGNSETKYVKPKLELEAKGHSAPIFVMRTHPRALERRIRYEEVQLRRETFERERRTMQFVNYDNYPLDEKEKRQRVKDYMQKHYAEKELKIMKEQERMNFLTDVENAKKFDRKRLLTHVMRQFRNLIQWKIRNQHVSGELRQRILIRNIFGKWKQHMICIWGDEREKAIEHHNRHCLKIAWRCWQQDYFIAQSHKLTAQDWFDLKLSERVFRAWYRKTEQTRQLFIVKEMQADERFNWLLKWRVLERWRRLHTILEIEKETELRRERWRIKANELILES